MDWSFARKHMARMYFDTCSVIEYHPVTEGHLTYVREVQVYTDIPCHISHNRVQSAKTVAPVENGVAYAPVTLSRLSLAPDIEIKPGSKIIVTRNGVSTAYKNSGEPAMFQTHQEIALTVEDERV